MKKVLCLLTAIAVFLCLSACGAEGSSSSEEVFAQQDSAAQAELAALVGKQLDGAPAGDTLSDRLCRCLYPYLLLQSGKGYTLFSDTAYAAEDYRELLNYVILQEHAEQAARAETAPSGQPVYYYEKEQYETWYHSYAANIPAEIFELSVETVDGAEYVPVPEMGWGNVRAFAIQSVESEGDQYTVGICETNSENDTSKQLTMTVRLSPDGFQYLSVTPPSAGD